VAKFRKPRIGGKHAETEHDKAAEPNAEHGKRREDPLHDVHVHSPRWHAPISATPEEEEAIKSDEELTDDDDTLEFERRRPLI
jgi:hypothetical protein